MPARGSPDSPDKVRSLREAIADLVQDGDMVFVGGFGQGVPFAAAHEIIRQKKRRLTLCRTGADIVFDLLVAAGCVERVIFGWYGNPGIGLSHVLRREKAAGRLRVEESSNFGVLIGLHAAALGVPFLPTRSLRGGDLPAVSGVAEVVCPFSGERLAAVEALRPDVALVHAHAADRFGNVVIRGVIGDTLEGAKAARTILCTTEQICDRGAIVAQPGATVLPAHRVAAVAIVEQGASPSYMDGLYPRDDAFYRRFEAMSRDPDQLQGFIDAAILSARTHTEYLAAARTPDGHAGAARD
jgi:glutaconate CoA-transferase subunit A